VCLQALGGQLRKSSPGHEACGVCEKEERRSVGKNVNRCVATRWAQVTRHRYLTVVCPDLVAMKAKAFADDHLIQDSKQRARSRPWCRRSWSAGPSGHRSDRRRACLHPH